MRMAIPVLVLVAAAGSETAAQEITPRQLKPGHKPVRHTHVLTSDLSWREYDFVIWPARLDRPYQRIELGEEFTFYPGFLPWVFAVPAGTPLPEDGSTEELDPSFADYPRSNRPLNRAGQVLRSDPTERLRTTWRLEGVGQHVVQIELDKLEKWDIYGKLIEKPKPPPDPAAEPREPQDRGHSGDGGQFWWYVAGGAAVLALLVYSARGGRRELPA